MACASWPWTPRTIPAKVGEDLTTAINCLERLGRVDEIDAFREGVIEAHKGNWRLLETAALSLTRNNWNDHFGFIVAGKFYRGHKHGGKAAGMSTPSSATASAPCS